MTCELSPAELNPHIRRAQDLEPGIVYTLNSSYAQSTLLALSELKTLQ